MQLKIKFQVHILCEHTETFIDMKADSSGVMKGKMMNHFSSLDFILQFFFFSISCSLSQVLASSVNKVWRASTVIGKDSGRGTRYLRITQSISNSYFLL